MSLLLKNTIIFLLLINLDLISIFSQELSSPLEPAELPKQIELGFVLGLGQNIQNGKYFPKCENCTFEDGIGFGYSLGVVFERDISKSIQWGATLLFDSRDIVSSNKIIENVEIKLSNESESVNRPIPFRHLAEFSIGFLSLMPYVKWSISDYFFVRLGASASYLLNADIMHSKELLKFKDTLSLNPDIVVDIKIDGMNEKIKVVEEGDIPEINNLQFIISPAIGFNFEISPQMYLSPIFQYSFPLTNINNLGDDFRISSWRIFVELRFAIKLRNYYTQ